MRQPKSTQPLTLGIVGAGQLARMMVQAAVPLGVRILLYAASASDGAALVCHDVTVGGLDDLERLTSFAAGCDAVTFDHEQVPPAALAALAAGGTRLAPGPAVLAVTQDKWQQRELAARLGLPAPAFASVISVDDITEFAAVSGWPVVLKAHFGGYDGRGVWVVAHKTEAAAVLAGAAERGLSLYVEQFVVLRRELAVLIARSTSGETVVYPLLETAQRDAICHVVRTPVSLDGGQSVEATHIAQTLADALQTVGMLAVELFETEAGALLLNEFAARTHNSGHLTIEANHTSQFENHIRAVVGLPLGDPGPRVPAAVMVNLLGGLDGADPAALLREALADPMVHVHLYGKEPRLGRKLGHVTVTGEAITTAEQRARRAVERLGGAL